MVEEREVVTAVESVGLEAAAAQAAGATAAAVKGVVATAPAPAIERMTPAPAAVATTAPIGSSASCSSPKRAPICAFGLTHARLGTVASTVPARSTCSRKWLA